MGRPGQGRPSRCRVRRSHQRREGLSPTPSLISLATLPAARERHSEPDRLMHIFPSSHPVIHRFLVRVSYLELYNEEVRDLLNKTVKKKLEVHVRPDIGVHVKDLSCFVVKNADEMEKLMNIGNKNSELRG